ncbi:MAG: aldose 1-epimerase [Hyphomonadaceae bacterium]|nr:aldose 1-epimerase [Hyphomonadaceae bacterium]
MTLAPVDREAPVTPPLVELRCDDLSLVLDPAKGARINSARYKGKDILRPVQEASDPDPFQSASFPLVPFSNRVRSGQFQYAGAPYQLGTNWSIEPNAIHGEGWTEPWRVFQSSQTVCDLLLTGTSWWPWAYECHQITELGPNWLRQTLKLTNLSDQRMPAGLGFHPYFPRDRETSLQFKANHVWPPLSEAAKAPGSVSGAFDFTESKRFESTHIDHCYEGWTGTAEIRNPGSSLLLSVQASENARHCVLYVPNGEPFFCFEPVSHLTGALNGIGGPHAGLAQLEPGESLSLWMQINISEGA